MKTILLTTALSILYAPAYACGNGECDPHPDEPGIETPDKPTEPEPQPEPEKPAPEKPQPEAPAPEPSQPEQPAPEPEKPAPAPEAETPAAQPSRPGHERDAKADRCGGWIWGQRHRAECDQRVTQPRYRLAAISDQSYVPPEKWQPLPQVCERTWFTLRFSIPAGMTKAAARQRCVEWLDGE